MIDSILNDVLSWVANLITTIFDALSAGMLDTLKPQISTMIAYFPFLEAAEKAIVYIGYSLLFLIVVWQLFRSFGGPLTEAENPTQLIVRSALFGLFIGFSAEIFDVLLRITLVPYNYLLNDVVIDQSTFSFAGLGDSINKGLAVNFVTQAGAAAIDLAAGSAVFVIIWIIILVIIGWNYIRLLLEAVERYVMVGVLYFTSPLAFASGASKSTIQVFKSWCRMVGSELFLLVMNVWFIRGFNTAIGKAIASGGILAGGGGNMYLCFFMLVGFLHVGQNMDKYLATLGMNTAQTGQGLMGDILIASRFAMGTAHAASAGSVFSGNHNGSHKVQDISSYKPGVAGNLSFERAKVDAMRDGGVSRGGNGPLAMAQNAAAKVAVNNGAMVSAKAIADVANMSSKESGIMKGEGLDKSLGNFIPALKGYDLSDTQLEGGNIRTTVTTSDGKSAQVELFSTSAYDAPEGPHSIVTDFDGNEWYQTAVGEAAGDFYDGKHFEGSMSEADEIAEEFPDNPEISSLRDVEPGVREAIDADGNRSMIYNSAYFDEPQAPHEKMTSKDGVEWYSVKQSADIPAFDKNGIAITESASDNNSPSVNGNPEVAGSLTGSEFGYGSYIEDNFTDETGDTSVVPHIENDAAPEMVKTGISVLTGNVEYNGSQEETSDKTESVKSGSDFAVNTDIAEKADTSAGVPVNMSVEPSAFAEKADISVPTTERTMVSGNELTHDEVIGAMAATGVAGMEVETTDNAGVISVGRIDNAERTESHSAEPARSMYTESVQSGYASSEACYADNSVSDTQNYESSDIAEKVKDSETVNSGNINPYIRTEETDALPYRHPIEPPEKVSHYARTSFQEFMPGYESKVSSVDSSMRKEGQLEVTHSDGTTTRFYDSAIYAPPKGNYKVYEDAQQHQWIAIQGKPIVEIRPVFIKGKPEYDKKGEPVTQKIRAVRYQNEPQRFATPERRTPDKIGNASKKRPRKKK